MNWLNILSLIFGAAEQIVPIFVHNPQSQKVEAIVMTTTNHALQTLAVTNGGNYAAPATAQAAPLGPVAVDAEA